MNHRIKKKLEKKARMSMMQFDPYLHKFVPVAKTYRGIKSERRKVHGAVVSLRHMTYQDMGYYDQLKDVRRLHSRKYARAFDEKLKHRELSLKEKQNESPYQKEEAEVSINVCFQMEVCKTW